MTNNLERRMYEHRHGVFPGFSKKYGCTRLVLIEEYSSPDDAIAREKELKGWQREKKLALIAESNPKWFDLSRDWDI
jgi:putative endonuclease